MKYVVDNKYFTPTHNVRNFWVPKTIRADFNLIEALKKSALESKVLHGVWHYFVSHAAKQWMIIRHIIYSYTTCTIHHCWDRRERKIKKKTDKKRAFWILRQPISATFWWCSFWKSSISWASDVKYKLLMCMSWTDARAL